MDFNKSKARTNTRFGRAFRMMFIRFTHLGGYSGRREFWHALLIAFLLLGIIGSITVWAAQVVGAFVIVIYGAALVFVSLAILSMLFRRLRDAGFPGWFPLAYVVIALPGNVHMISGYRLTLGDIGGMVVTVFFLVLAVFPTSSRLTIIKPGEETETDMRKDTHL